MKVKPFQLYGRSFSQIVSVLLLEVFGLTVKTKVAKLSQPSAFVKVAVWLPAVEKVKPFQLYGKSFSQIVSVLLLEVFGFTVNTKVAKLSQPSAFVKVAVWLPAAVKLKPFQLYGRSFSQIVAVLLLEVFGLTVKTKVAKLSQPFPFVKVAV